MEFDAKDFRVTGRRRIKCYQSEEDSYPGSERSIDLFLPSEIANIKDDHGREVYRA
jgi:hypothetical protein